MRIFWCRSMALYILVLVLLNLQCVCNAQEIDEVSCDDEESNCTRANSCIRYYDDLQSYVLNNTGVMRSLKETFFKSGEDPSVFVKITYHFQLPRRIPTIDSIINCINQTSTFIWSESALYLFGPRPLFWYTLFALNIPEASVSLFIYHVSVMVPMTVF